MGEGSQRTHAGSALAVPEDRHRRLPHVRDLVAKLYAVPVAEDAALLQLRVRLYLGFLGLLWGATFPLAIGVALVANQFALAGIAHPLLDMRGPWLHGVVAVTLLGLWASLRKEARSASTLGRIDAFATLFQAAVLSVYVLWDDPRFRPEIESMLALVNILFLRAALVPSSPKKTLSVGAGAALALVAGTVLLNRGRASPLPYTLAATVGVLVAWCVVAIVGSTLVSGVIHGLRRRVDAALQIGQYTLEEKLGEGGMGVVYRARHALLRRPTAIKILPDARTSKADLVRFEREVQLTSKLAHPNIVAIYDFGRSATGIFYYAMEYLDGVDLELLVREDGPQPAARVLHVLTQAAEALAEAHAVGLIHRDVKPANMIVGGTHRRHDVLKLVDFGLVKSVGSSTTGAAGQASDFAVLRGTPLYMAPEAITAPDETDARTDLYSLGAVGYFLLTAQPVFDGRSVVEVCSHHLHTDVVPIGERVGLAVPASLEAVLMRCLAKKQADRYASADALLEALAACTDVPRWSEAAARAWWASRGASVRAKRQKGKPVAGRRRAFAVDKS